MYGLICVYTSTEAAAYLGNITTGKLVSFVKDGSSEGLSVTGASGLLAGVTKAGPQSALDGCSRLRR
jgi:hypothetical protein